MVDKATKRGPGLGMKPSKGRILPSSTADVQAAIAAIQARSAALRRQTANSMSALNNQESRFDRSLQRKDSLGNSSIDSNESNVGEEYFTDIGNVIDQVNGRQKQEFKMDDQAGPPESISESYSDVSSDDSLIAEGMVSTATQMNIGAFIDSLNAAKKTFPEKKSTENKIPIDENNLNENAGKNISKSDGMDQEKQSTEDGQPSGAANDPGKKISEPSVDEEEEKCLYDKELLETHVNKVIALADSNKSGVSDLEYAIFYAWKGRVPIIPLIDAFNEAMEGKEACAAVRFTHFIREAVNLIESDNITAKTSREVLNSASQENFDVSILKTILKSPQKHVKYVKPVPEEAKEFIEDTEDLNAIKENDSKENSISGDGSRDGSRDVPRRGSTTRRKKHHGPTGIFDLFRDVSMDIPVDVLYNKTRTRTKSWQLASSVSNDSTVKEKRHRLYFQYKMQKLVQSKKQFLHSPKLSVPKVDGVKATKHIFTRPTFQQQPIITPFRVGNWRLTTKERISQHPGYKSVNVKSLSKTAVQAGNKKELENFEWENLGGELKTVQPLDDNINWFGSLTQTRLNKRIVESTTQTNQIMMKRLMYPKQWEEEWYLTWLTRKRNLVNLKRNNSARPFLQTVTRNGSGGSDGNSIDDEKDQHNVQNIGKIYTVRYRSGERMSRVHYDYTSFLYRSKWKRKYFPKGVFAHT